MYPVKAEKNIVINYTLEQVKKAIKHLFENFPDTYQYREEECNEVFNIYRFPMLVKHYACIIDLTAEEAEEQKTRIVISAVPLHGARTSQALLTRLLNEYLLALGNVLDGKELPRNDGQSDGGYGYISIMFFIIAIVIIITAFIF